MLPAYNRNFIGTLEEFKNAVDIFLENIPDKPAISGMYPDPVSRANVTSIRNSNSLTDWILHLGLRERRLDIPDDIQT